MALTLDEVRKIASLARLRFAPADEARFADQLDKIVGYIDQLARFATVESRAAGASPSQQAADEPTACLPTPVMLANAPAAMDGFLLVPEVKGGTENA